jgi:hypothetical protein
MPSSTLRRLFAVAAALCFFPLSRAAFAQDPQLLVGARVVGESIALAWADTSEGLRLDDERAQAVIEQFTGTDWAFFDNSQLVIGKNAEPILSLFFAATEDRTFFIIHRRESTFQVDGKVIRDAATKEGFADLYITTIAEDGTSSSTVFLEVGLNFTQ